ncbi:MAG: ATP-binding protein [Lachnospiraceae bacterium]|nr:ATP-binding protein [Lachnospiraceae bacterium]
MKKLNIEAKTENLDQVLAFVEEQLDELDCPPAKSIQISVAVEEVFVNISNYAYSPSVGQAEIFFDHTDDSKEMIMTFTDSGVPFNPLEREDPDVTLPAEQRQIGGLGIFMVKKSMDDVKYEYKDGKNILTIRKFL